MKLDPILSKAVRLARKKKYDSAIKTLETESNRYYGSYNYYYLLGVSYLYSSVFGMALTYLKLAIEKKKRDPNALLGLAVLYLNHGDTDKAVDVYLEVQSIEDNPIAKKALKLIRKYPSQESMSAWIDSGKLHKLFPPLPKLDVSAKSILFGVLIGLAGLSLLFAIAVKTGIIPMPEKPGERVIPYEALLEKEEMDAPVQTGGSYRYVLTAKQVLDDYNDARKLFTEYRDDAAKVKLNRILESNAAEPVKNKARLLLSYTTEPGFNNLKDKFSYSDVIKEPFIYRDCHVIWRGMASNLVSQQDHTSFDFLVGYDTYRTMEGIVQVNYNFAIPVNPERPVEILGRVIPLSADREPRIRIQGVALNQAGLLDQTPNR